MPSNPPITIRRANRPPQVEPAEPKAKSKPPSDSLTLTESDMAQEFRCDGQTIRRRVKAGLIPRPVKIGRHKRWLRATIVEWLAAGCPPCGEGVDRDC